MSLHAVLDRAIAQATADRNPVLQARGDWDRLAGKVYDDEPLFEERAAAFLEWFLIEWSPEAGRPAIRSLIESATDEERIPLEAISGAHRSLFQVREVLSDGVRLVDLWGGGAFRVKERRRLVGLQPGELLDARLIADALSPPDLLFGTGLCFHPREVEPEARRCLAAARASGVARGTILFRLLRARVRWERFRHLSAERIYAQPEYER